MSLAPSPMAPAPERERGVDGGALASGLAAITALVPRFVTSGAYLAAWIVPQRVPPEVAKGLLVGMLLEFLLIHSYAFLNLAFGADQRARAGQRMRRALTVLAFGAFYLLMAGAIAAATQSMTPVWAIGWLLASRVFEIAVGGEADSATADSRKASWIRHVALYIFLAVLTAIVPLPAFGLSSDVVAGSHPQGSGVWVEKPQSLLAFGFLYFGLGAYFDLRARLRR